MIKPMLAYKAGQRPMEWGELIFIQPKLDGVRCVIQQEYDNVVSANVIKAYSRTGKEWKNIDHILAELQPFFKENPDIILDGELYNHDLRDNFEKIISLVRKTKPTIEDREESKSLVEFHCYDYMNHNSYIEAIENYHVRYTKISSWFNNSYNSIYASKTTPVPSMEQAQIEHQLNLHDGYEGSILRLDKPYERKRSYNLQKFKDFSDKEAVIIDYVEGKGKRAGTLGKFIMRDEIGIEFGCPPGKGFNYADLANILDNIDDYIGQTATFTYFERTKANSYRHPQFKCIRNYE